MKAAEVLYMGDSYVTSSSTYVIDPNTVYYCPLLNFAGKVSWALALCSLIALELWNAWQRK
jgi:hypothetical protein